MPDTIGNITVPVIPITGTFPLVSEYPYGRAHRPEIVTHLFANLAANLKIEQRYLLGNGAKQFTWRRSHLPEADRVTLRTFWENRSGGYEGFVYNAPNDDGSGTTAFNVRFANEPLSWEFLVQHASTVGLTFVEIPSDGSAPSYTPITTETRFPGGALKAAMLAQVQQMIPLVKLVTTEPGYPAIYLSDRRCTVGGQLYLARLLTFDGIQQSLGGAADAASFKFGNADRVMRALTNDTDLWRASVEFSLFHVGQKIKLDLWKGEITGWAFDAGGEFSISAADGLYELNLPYPTRRISRSCWKAFDDGLGCPYTAEGTLDTGGFPLASATSCDKGFDTANGCRAHTMMPRFGGLIAEPQGVRIKDNSTGLAGLGRRLVSATSLVAESIYDQVLPEIYTDSDFPTNALVAAGRDEGDFYAAIGLVGEGPLTAYKIQDFEVSPQVVPHLLDGQPPHGADSKPPRNNYGFRSSLGPDPNPEPFGLSTAADLYTGSSSNKRAAGTAFFEIRRTDTKGFQLSKLAEHEMKVVVAQGLNGFSWTGSGAGTPPSDAPFTRVTGTLLTNPIWIAVNMLLRARGLRFASAAVQEGFFDPGAAIRAAYICDLSVPKLVGAGNETQFPFRGVIADEKPLRDWLQEVLMGCLGYFTFAFGKLRLGVRVNSSVEEAFTDGNIIFASLRLASLAPTFNHLTTQFADSEFEYVSNSLTVYDIDHAKKIGGATSPLFNKANINLLGCSGKSQAARVVSVRLREETGGIYQSTVARPSLEWLSARQIAVKTTVLALNVEPGMVCSMTSPDMPGHRGTCNTAGTAVARVTGDQFDQTLVNHTIRIGAVDYIVVSVTDASNLVLGASAGAQSGVAFTLITGEFRVTGWRLNSDFSIDIEGRSTTDNMYDLVVGPKPADVPAAPLPGEDLYAAADWNYSAETYRDGVLRLRDFTCATNAAAVHRGDFRVYFIREESNALCLLTADITAGAATLTYAGDPPVVGQWILLEAEVMLVTAVTPAGNNTGTATITRGQLGTTAASHLRASTTVSAKVDNADFTIGAGLSLKAGSLLTRDPAAEQRMIAEYVSATGKCRVNLPFTSLSVAEAVFSDPRIFRVEMEPTEVPFAPRFFKSADRANFEHTVETPFAGVVCVEGTLVNTRDVRSNIVRKLFNSAFPYRIRTMGKPGQAGFMLTHPNVPSGVTLDLFESIRGSQPEAFAEAFAEIVSGGSTGEPISTPRTVTAIVPANLVAGGSITIAGTITSAGRIRVVVGNKTTDRVYIEAPVFSLTTETTATQVAAALAAWLNATTEVAAFFSATSAGAVVSLTDKVGTGGVLSTVVTGGVTATPVGMTSQLGILTGRRYAVVFHGGIGDSELSPLSESTGPTGGAARVELKDVPIPLDARITDVRLYAAPDGKNSPFYLVQGSGSPFPEFMVDTVTEALLTSQSPYPGAGGPAQAGACKVTVNRDGSPWFEVRIPATTPKSNVIDGLALGHVSVGEIITADIDNAGQTGELKVVIQ